MLIKLLPEQIAKQWGDIRESLFHTLPPTVDATELVLSNILKAAIEERIQVWVMYEPNVEKNKSDLQAIVLTTFADDLVTGTRNLVILSLYGMFEGNGDVKNWKDALLTIKKFAQGSGCIKIVAYSDRPSAIALAERLGADVSYRFIDLGL